MRSAETETCGCAGWQVLVRKQTREREGTVKRLAPAGRLLKH